MNYATFLVHNIYTSGAPIHN